MFRRRARHVEEPDGEEQEVGFTDERRQSQTGTGEERSGGGERVNSGGEGEGESDEAADDEVLIVLGMGDDPSLRRTALEDANGEVPPMWDGENDAAHEERRRNVIRREIERVQRANFIHFVLLCLVPTSLLLIVVASILGENDDCVGESTYCANEPRTFINAFTTRCICDAVVVEEVED